MSSLTGGAGSVSQSKLRKTITGMNDGEIIEATRTKIQEELDDVLTMFDDDIQEVPPDFDRLLTDGKFFFDFNGQRVHFSKRMKMLPKRRWWRSTHVSQKNLRRPDL